MRVSSTTKDPVSLGSHTATVIACDSDTDDSDSEQVQTSAITRTESLRLPHSAKVLIAKGSDWTSACDEEVDALRALVLEGGVGEIKLDRELLGGAEGEEGVVVLKGGEDGGWGTIGRGCVEWGIRVRW